jgi:hypothetical protein
MRMPRFAWVLAVGLGLAVGCGGGGGDPGDDQPDGPADAPQFGDTASFVELTTQVFEQSESMYLRGSLFTPEPTQVYAVDAPVGACRYSQKRADDTCAPACDYPDACVDGTCIGYPVPQSAGNLELASGGVTRTVEPVEGAYYLSEDAVPWDPGATITLTAAGDTVAGFTAAAELSQPLVAIGLNDLVLREGDDLTIRWQPADPGSRIRITLGADRGHAQQRAALIECDLPDEAGSVTIGGDMVTRFVDPQNWACGDCFSQEIKRYRRATAAAGSTPVTFWVSSADTFYLVPDRE